MKSLQKLLVSSLLVCLFTLGGPGLWADNCEDAYAAFVKSDFDTAIQICLTADNCGFMCDLNLAFAFLERSELNKSKKDWEISQKLIKDLEKRIDLQKIELLVRFSRLLDKQATIKICGQLAEVGFDKAETQKDYTYLIQFLKPRYNEVVYVPAIRALYRFLKANREYVMKKGGTIPVSHREIFTSKELMDTLLELGTRTDLASDCLVIIEEPAIAYLEKISDPWVEKVIKRIRSSIADRREKYPQSTWYGATPIE